MRISDWSSDVCSSDLSACGFAGSSAPLAQAARSSVEARTVSDKRKDTGSSNVMWGGRFAEGPSAIMREINASIPFDKALWRQDIVASKAHVAMLAAQGIVTGEDAAAITDRKSTRLNSSH